jgi:hypothetical protein
MFLGPALLDNYVAWKKEKYPPAPSSEATTEENDE